MKKNLYYDLNVYELEQLQLLKTETAKLDEKIKEWFETIFSEFEEKYTNLFIEKKDKQRHLS